MLMNPMEPTCRSAATDRSPRIPELGKLRRRHDPVLTRGKNRQRLLTSPFVAHSETKSEVSKVRPAG
jgi:hypothetical protein